MVECARNREMSLSLGIDLMKIDHNDNGRRMLEHNNSDEKYVTSVRQLGMEETPPASHDKCDQFAETSDPPHAEDEEARYHHEEDELSLNY